VHFLVPEQRAEYLAPDLDPRVHVSALPLAPWHRPLRQARDCRAVVRAVRELDPGVVHLQQGHHLFNLLLRALRDYPLVVTIHEPSEWRRPRRGPRRRPQRLLEVAFRRADQLIVHGEAVRSAVLRRGRYGAPVHVIPRAAPSGLARGGGGAPGGPPTVLFFGRIWPYKGLDQLVRAEPLVAEAVAGLQTVIAGEGEGLGRYRRLMVDPRRFDLRDRFIPRAERDELFAAASVVVLPYVDASTSAVIPLAYLYGKPVVVTSAGGLAEDVEDGRTGLVVAPRDHEALARAITRLLADPALARRLGEAGRRKLETDCAPAAVAARTLDVYARAMGRRAAA
jgi:starch synthase